MPVSLPNKTTTDNYADTTLGGGSLYAKGQITIANNPVSILVTTASEYGQEQDTEYPFVTTQIFPLVSAEPGNDPKRDRIVRAQIKSAISGQPAQVSGWLLEPGIAGPEIGSLFTAKIAASGTITPGLSSVQINHNGSLVGTEPVVNLIDGNGVAVVATDVPGSTRVDLALQTGGASSFSFIDPGSVDFFANGIWLIEVVLNVGPDSPIGAAIIACSTNTGGSNTRSVTVFSSVGNPAGNIGATFTVVSNLTVTGALRIATAASSGLAVTVRARRITGQ